MPEEISAQELEQLLQMMLQLSGLKRGFALEEELSAKAQALSAEYATQPRSALIGEGQGSVEMFRELGVESVDLIDPIDETAITPFLARCSPS